MDRWDLISLLLYAQSYSYTIHVYAYIMYIYSSVSMLQQVGVLSSCTAAQLHRESVEPRTQPCWGRLEAAGTLDWMNSVERLSFCTDPGWYAERECVDDVSKNVPLSVYECACVVWCNDSCFLCMCVCVCVCVFVCVGCTSLCVCVCVMYKCVCVCMCVCACVCLWYITH